MRVSLTSDECINGIGCENDMTKANTKVPPRLCTEPAIGEVTGMITSQPGIEEVRQLEISLHDLCQPLTTLQCSLEIAEMDDTDAGYRAAVKLAVAECARVVSATRVMSRDLLLLEVALQAKK